MPSVSICICFGADAATEPLNCRDALREIIDGASTKVREEPGNVRQQRTTFIRYRPQQHVSLTDDSLGDR